MFRNWLKANHLRLVVLELRDHDTEVAIVKGGGRQGEIPIYIAQGGGVRIYFKFSVPNEEKAFEYTFSLMEDLLSANPGPIKSKDGFIPRPKID